MLLEKISKSNGWAVGYLWSPDCKVCAHNSPVVDRISEKYSSIPVVRINLGKEDEAKFAEKIPFTALPYYAVYHLGEFVGGEPGGGEGVPTAVFEKIKHFMEQTS